MINGFANRRLNPLGYTRFSVWDLWLRIYFNLQSQIQNHKLNWRGRRDSNPQSPTWRAGGLTICLRPQNVRGEIWTFNLLSLSQPPLAKLGYASIRSWDFIKSAIPNSKSKIKLVDWKGFKPLREVCRTSTLSSYIISPKNWCRRRDFHPHESHSHKAGWTLCVSSFRHFDVKINTDGESRTHITTLLRRVPLAVGLRRRNFNQYFCLLPFYFCLEIGLGG